MKFRIERNGSLITIWNDAEGIGLQFTEGEALQAYTSGIILQDTAILSTEEGVAKVSELQAELTEYAVIHFPKEFETLKDDVI